MGHMLHTRCGTTSSDHQRWASQFPCPQRSLQPLGTQDKYTNDWVTAPGVVRPASRGAEGGEWVGMCVQVRAVVTWGDRELRPHGTDTQQEGCVCQQLFRDRNRTFDKSCRPCSSVSSGCQRLPFSLRGLLWRSHMLLHVIKLEIYKGCLHALHCLSVSRIRIGTQAIWFNPWTTKFWECSWNFFFFYHFLLGFASLEKSLWLLWAAARVSRFTEEGGTRTRRRWCGWTILNFVSPIQFLELWRCLEPPEGPPYTLRFKLRRVRALAKWACTHVSGPILGLETLKALRRT